PPRSSWTPTLSPPPRASVAPSSTAPPPSYHSRTASIPRRVVTPPPFGTTHSTSSARTSSTAGRSKFAARQRLTTSIASLLTPRAYADGPNAVEGPTAAQTTHVCTAQLPAFPPVDSRPVAVQPVPGSRSTSAP